MAKSEIRLKAIDFRKKGESVRNIAKRLGVAKSTASLWTRHIILTVEQLENLHHRRLKGGELGRTKGALIQKERRTQKYLDATNQVKTSLGRLSQREKLLIGSALYWAEGTKKGRRVDFCNSDPDLVKFMIAWFKEHFGIKNDEFRIQLGINEEHAPREKTVKEYWSNQIEIPPSQFTKTSFKHAKLKKTYENFNDYFGTPKIYITRPSRIHPRVLGLVEYLKKRGYVAQW
ncbi:helix-turn-helix domain-containing protein [Candidatus Amesbacteria bacterium]|nr:helix-turn-helix domain-containing protein [Candidatus Amesbacteria bacterium]